jgi:hypothetical protein
MEAIAVQDNGTEASHGTTMEDISMDERAAVVEGTETRQGELAIEDGSVGNGTVDADGAQARGVKGVSEVQDAQVVGGNGLMVSGSILRQNEMKIGGTLGSYRHSGLQKLLEPLEQSEFDSLGNGVEGKMTRNEWEKHQRDHGQG